MFICLSASLGLSVSPTNCGFHNSCIALYVDLFGLVYKATHVGNIPILHFTMCERANKSLYILLLEIMKKY